MYVNAYIDETRPAVRRRRRARRRRIRAVRNAANFLMLTFLVIGVLHYIFQRADGAVVHFEKDSNQEGTTGLFNADTVAPEISGVEDRILYEGGEIAYRSGVTVKDNMDDAPELTVDSSAVDLSKAGTYQVIYTAKDSAGNVITQTANVTVLEKQEGYADLATIYAAVDAKLSEILLDGMTTYEQVESIYNWARQSLTYGGHSNRSDWYQAAYEMLSQGTGDCYGYFAVTKLMFQRLEIPNIDVTKVKNSEDDSEHFWSLVSVDGGENYYHFDSTPRYGDGDNFLLVTDAFLDAYSEAHDNCHNRDKSLYPATPEEALQ